MRTTIALLVLLASGCGRTESTYGGPGSHPPPYLDAGDAAWDASWDSGPDAGTDPPADAPVYDVPWDVEPPPGTCPPGWSCRNYELPVFRGVDILVVVDNSMSMAEEQATMARQFPELISSLLDPEINPTTSRPVHVPITDLHIGVVSTDMGTGGYSVETCSDPIDGDDGILQHRPNPLIAGCEDEYPKYLTYDVASPRPGLVDGMATDFGCIGVLGIDGCGFEQQLKAGLKALTTHAAWDGENGGFLRDDTVLMVIWLSDEEDCSVALGNEGIFDTLDSSLGHLGLRCFHHPYMIEPVDTYVLGFADLRAGSLWPMIMGMIVGVPEGEKDCVGFGSDIGECLDHPDMIERIDPISMTRLVPSCVSGSGEAYAPRRFVQLAQSFGSGAYVHSICSSDYEPALKALSRLVNSVADLTCEGAIVDLVKDPGDDCLCNTDCAVVHVLADRGPCPDSMREWDHDGDTIPNVVRNGSGSVVKACEVSYAGTRIESCSRDCHDPYQVYRAAGVGWYYSLSYTGVACPSVSFTAGSGPPAGASTFVACPP
ncbi:MAG: hypothetical protein JRG91_13780 [Deltaproteobacteria bacterium]|nr:hypothetical protein [Deltaproteobacteria bacterium]